VIARDCEGYVEGRDQSVRGRADAPRVVEGALRRLLGKPGEHQ